MIDRFARFLYDINEVSKYLRKIETQALKKYDLKAAHAIYLTILYRYKDGITAVKLSEISGKDKADVSRMINIIEQKGLIEKLGNNGNFYRGLIKLTNEGKKVAEDICKMAEKAVNLAGGKLTEKDRRNFYETLESISESLGRIVKDGLLEG